MKLQISRLSPSEVQQEKKDDECVSCSGSGYYDRLNKHGRAITCGACGGTGKNIPEMKAEDYETCYACDGEGYDDEELDDEGELIPCTVCDGTGARKLW